MTRALLPAALLILSSACDDTQAAEPEATEPASDPEAAAVRADETDPPDRPAREAELEQGPPPTRQHDLPAPDRLGQLPEGTGIPVGRRAPDATVEDSDGEPVRLHELVAAHGPIVLVFYRGGWCPYCNFQIRELTQAFPELRERGVTPVAISVDRPEESAKTRSTYDIPFPVLSDPDLAAHRAYRVAHEVDDEELRHLEGYGIDIEAASGRDHHVIAIPSIFVIDADGVVRWAHADPDYHVRPSPEQVLEAIDALEL